MIRILPATFLTAVLSSCGITNLDKPMPTQKDHWVKPGFTREDIDNVLREECGFDKNNWTVFLQEKIDLCMLNKGFKFRDFDYGGRCKHPQYQHLPSCRSLRK